VHIASEGKPSANQLAIHHHLHNLCFIASATSLATQIHVGWFKMSLACMMLQIKN
jgi:hypothetical protein